MATPPPAPPSQGFPNPKSHQGTGGSPSGWLHRRKKNVADVAGVIGDIAHILHQRHEHMRLHRVATEPNRQGIQQAHNEHVQYSRAYVEMHDALKKKAKFSNVCDEIIGEIKHKRVHIDATYRAETIGLHAWNPLDWGALAAASGKHTLSVVKHHLEVAAAHVWTPGAIARHTQYKTQLRDLGESHIQATSLHQQTIEQHRDEIRRHREMTDSMRPSVIGYLRSLRGPKQRPTPP